jgi:23S rRNA pseudouridine2605 synthase
MERMNEHDSPKPTQNEERLARFLAHAGIASRRRAEELITAGRVQVNGITVTTQGTRINPLEDRVSVNGKVVEAAAQHVYLLLHKPVGYVSTASDPQRRPTVIDLLPPDVRRLRVYPVGRLDIDSSGLLLLTNDGDFALHLSHPRYSVEKRYEALVQGHPAPATLEALRKGVVFTEDDGTQHKSAAAQVRVLDRKATESWLELILHEGRKRQVRRMLAAVGHPVRQLVRVGIGSVTLKGVAPGEWRHLRAGEIASLRQRTGTE